MSQLRPATSAVQENRRRHSRSAVSLDAQLFVPAEESELSCQVVEISVGGAHVICRDMPPIATHVILYVTGFGRLPAIVERYDAGIIALRFDLSQTECERLAAQIKTLLKSGIVGVTNLRRYRRIPVPAEGTFLCADGQEFACCIRDFSLQGIFLETDRRPPVGDLIRLGHHQGRVVRHDKNGLAIQFMTVRRPSGSQENQG
jgi:hypothetical protein